jgi:hypothetical protein
MVWLGKPRMIGSPSVRMDTPPGEITSADGRWRVVFAECLPRPTRASDW